MAQMVRGGSSCLGQLSVWIDDPPRSLAAAIHARELERFVVSPGQLFLRNENDVAVRDAKPLELRRDSA